MQLLKAQLASTELMTIVAGFLSSWLFYFVFHAINSFMVWRVGTSPQRQHKLLERPAAATLPDGGAPRLRTRRRLPRVRLAGGPRVSGCGLLLGVDDPPRQVGAAGLARCWRTRPATDHGRVAGSVTTCVLFSLASVYFLQTISDAHK